MAAPEDILLTQETIRQVTEFSRPDLEEWIRSRFQGDDTFFYDPMKGEFPGAKIAWIYKEHNKKDSFRQDIETIAEKLLRETLKEKEPDLDKAFQLLDMMESGGFEKPSDYIKTLVESEKYKGKQTVYGDLQEKLLLTLVSMRVSFLEPDFWRQQMSDFRYAYAGFLGLFYLLKPDFDALLPDFKKLIAHKLKHPDEIEIDFIIMLFIDYMGKEDKDFCKLIQKHFQEDSEEWKLLDEELTAFDKHLPLRIRVPGIPLELKLEEEIVFMCLAQNKPSRTLHHPFHLNP